MRKLILTLFLVGCGGETAGVGELQFNYCSNIFQAASLCGVTFPPYSDGRVTQHVDVNRELDTCALTACKGEAGEWERAEAWSKGVLQNPDCAEIQRLAYSFMPNVGAKTACYGVEAGD